MEMKRVLTSRTTEQRPLGGGRLAQRPRSYRVRILGGLPTDLVVRVSRLHASAIQGRDDTVRGVRRTGRPDDEASGRPPDGSPGRQFGRILGRRKAR